MSFAELRIFVPCHILSAVQLFRENSFMSYTDRPVRTSWSPRSKAAGRKGWDRGGKSSGHNGEQRWLTSSTT